MELADLENKSEIEEAETALTHEYVLTTIDEVYIEHIFSTKNHQPIVLWDPGILVHRGSIICSTGLVKCMWVFEGWNNIKDTLKRYDTVHDFIFNCDSCRWKGNGIRRATKELFHLIMSWLVVHKKLGTALYPSARAKILFGTILLPKTETTKFWALDQP